MSEELKPCPFCGGSKVQIIDYEFTDQIECDECGNLVRPSCWNTRPIEDALRAENKRLREELINVVSIITGSQKGFFGEVLTYMPHFAERYVDTLIKFLYHADAK